MAHSVLAVGRDALPSSGLLLESAARTATHTSDDFGTLGASGLIVVVNVTAASATPSVVFTIQGVVYINGTAITWTILASAAVTGVGTTVLQVHPDLTAAANTKAAELVPDKVRLLCTHADADSITYTAHVILTP